MRWWMDGMKHNQFHAQVPNNHTQCVHWLAVTQIITFLHFLLNSRTYFFHELCQIYIYILVICRCFFSSKANKRKTFKLHYKRDQSVTLNATLIRLKCSNIGAEFKDKVKNRLQREEGYGMEEHCKSSVTWVRCFWKSWVSKSFLKMEKDLFGKWSTHKPSFIYLWADADWFGDRGMLLFVLRLYFQSHSVSVRTFWTSISKM